MSKHSKNNTSSTIFTHMQRQKLKNVYGTITTRLGTDSLKKFEECNLCQNVMTQPCCCDQGHTFCRECVIEFMVKTKKAIALSNELVDKQRKADGAEKQKEMLKKQTEIIEAFEKRDSLLQVTPVVEIEARKSVENFKKLVKPTGLYQIDPKKEKFLNASFWAIENATTVQDKLQKTEKHVKCPAGTHKLLVKKLRNLNVKRINTEYCCWVCSKQLKLQRLGAYSCGHVVCFGCKGELCEVCSAKDSWLDIQRTGSAFSSHNKVEVQTYTYAFQV